VVAAPLGTDNARARMDGSAAIGRIARVEHDEAGIVHPAVGIFEGRGIAGLERRPCRVVAQVEAARGRQQLAAAQMVVEEEAEAQHPGRTEPGMVRQDETQRPDDVGGEAPQHLALHQRLAHQAELVVLEIAQSTVDELGGRGGGGAGEVALLEEDGCKSPSGRIARDAAAIDAPSDDSEVVDLLPHASRSVHLPRMRSRRLRSPDVWQHKRNMFRKQFADNESKSENVAGPVQLTRAWTAR